MFKKFTLEYSTVAPAPSSGGFTSTYYRCRGSSYGACAWRRVDRRVVLWPGDYYQKCRNTTNPPPTNRAFKTTSYSNNPVPSNKYNPHGNATSSLPQINNSTTGLGAGSHGNNTNTSYLTGLTQHAWSTRHHKAAKVRKTFFWWLMESYLTVLFTKPPASWFPAVP